MNNYFLKLHGKANIPVPLGIGHNFHVEADCSITQENKIDNEDGTFDIVYRTEPVTVTISKDNGPTLKAKDPRKNSVKFRNYLYKIYTQEGVVEDFDQVYDEVILVAMSRMPELLTDAVKRLNEKVIHS